ncbi:hypothetical protein [Streptomyces palmae]|uniref:Uncharacterized protein n=1 Tax=Streptomyces palmae TaxID=1701085 RepID=A0A4Z0HCC0_9ACTN|nr:hypothetical protein [Streptomyces palmae]TGB10820.1 hypothetical protein E4099_12460 [Streptomyces palmae]
MSTLMMTRPTNGVIDDIEREDDQRGYETEPEAALGDLLRRLVREGDAKAARAGRRTPRILAEMQPRLDTPIRCPKCQMPFENCRSCSGLTYRGPVQPTTECPVRDGRKDDADRGRPTRGGDR